MLVRYFYKDWYASQTDGDYTYQLKWPVIFRDNIFSIIMASDSLFQITGISYIRPIFDSALKNINVEHDL